SSNRIRIADVCLISGSEPVEQVPTNPPLAIVEVIDSDDRFCRYNDRLSDYRRMGVANVWALDPINKVGYDCSTAAWLPVEEFRIADTPIFFRLSELWNEMQTNQ